MRLVSRLIEVMVIAMCSPWTSIAVSAVSCAGLGAAIVLRFNGE